MKLHIMIKVFFLIWYAVTKLCVVLCFMVQKNLYMFTEDCLKAAMIYLARNKSTYVLMPPWG